MFFNTELSPEFAQEDDDKVVSFLKSKDNMTSLGEAIEGKAFAQTVARVAHGGMPADADEAFNKLSALEVKIRNEFAIPSARPGGDRSKGTGFKLHPTFKSYKSTIKGAFEHGVELLDASGMPRSRGDIAEDIKSAKHSEKSDEEKFVSMVSSLLTVYHKCDKSNANVVAAATSLYEAFRDGGSLTLS